MGISYVAEAGQTMRGDIGLAVEMVYAFAEAGATHFKVQMLRPETIATDTAMSYWQTGPSVSQRDSFADNGLIPYDGWGRVRAACDAAKIGFVATPFDLEAVAALRDLDPAAVKIASGDVTFFPLLDAVAKMEKTVLLSTGAADLDEIHFAMSAFVGVPVIPFACTLRYPTPITQARLRRIRVLQNRYRVAGYSDHTVEWETSFAAVLAGASWLEKHVTPNPGDDFVPDDVMGLGAADFARYVGLGADAVLLLMHDGEDVDESAARVGARRAARFAANMPAGSRVNVERDVTFLRPCPDGSAASIELAMLDGLVTRQRVFAGEILSEGNVAVATP